MRFAFVTDELPRPGAAGHLALNYAIIEWLTSLGHQVEVLLVGTRLRWPVERYGLASVTGPSVAGWGDYVVAAAPWAAARTLAGGLARLLPARLGGAIRRRSRARRFGSVDAVLGAFITPAQVAWCADHIARTRPDAVLADTIFRAAVLQAPALAGRRGVIIAHDVFFLRHRALESAGYLVYPAALTRETEAGLLNAATAIAAIQPEEAAAIRAMCPDRHVVSAPMPALRCQRPPELARRPGRLVFVGSASLPNLDGLRWFLESVWPILRRRRADITLDIVGDCGARLARLPEGVNRLGRVKTLAPVLHHAALAIAPLRVGSGLKIKLLDYARHGLVTVGTPASLSGFAADPAAPFIAATGELGFASAILRELGGPPRDERALAYVDRHYGTAASFAGLAQVLGLSQPLPVV
jgi:hypothetical protein